MYVCICNAISEKMIRENPSLANVVGSKCGKCLVPRPSESKIGIDSYDSDGPFNVMEKYMVKVIRGDSYNDDTVFDVVKTFRFASVRTLYEFVKNLAILAAEGRQENSMGHDAALVEMSEGINGLPLAEIYVDGRIVTRFGCEKGAS